MVTMKTENLGNLLYYYIEVKKTCDVVDSPIKQANQENFQDEFDFSCRMRGGAHIDEVPSHLTSFPIVPCYYPLSVEQQQRVSSAGRRLAEITVQFSASQPDKSSIKFESSCLFVKPEKQIVSIPILRSPGFNNIPLKVIWKTCDKTALSGTHYVYSSGEILFDKNEMEKDIKIEILPCNADSDLRFQVELAVENSVFNPRPMTVNIQNYSNEHKIIGNLLQSSPSLPSDVFHILKNSLNSRTFHIGLSYLCSKADSLSLELGLACELSMLCLSRLNYELVFSILTDFFKSSEDEIDL